MSKVLIVGCGHMGSALLKSWIGLKSYSFAVVDPYNHKELKSKPVDNFGAKCLKVNIASDLELNNFEVANLVADCLNKEFDYEYIDVPSNRPGHDLRYALDNSVLKNVGWKPEKSSSEGIEKIVKWYTENQEWLTY